MRKVAIIGLGWLGLPLAQYLSKLGWEVKGTKRTATNIDGIQTFRFSLGDQFDEKLNELFQVDSLVFNISPSEFSDDDYVNGIKSLVDKAVESGIQHLIFVSSTGVFPQKSGVFDEHCVDLLETSTVKVERWLQSLPIHCDILRLAGLVGKNRHPVFHLVKKKTVLNNGNQPVNLVHQQDVIRAIELLLNQPNQQRIFHLCASQHPTRSEYYSAMARKFGTEESEVDILHFLPDISPLVRLISGEKISRELGFHYQFDDPFIMPID